MFGSYRNCFYSFDCFFNNKPVLTEKLQSNVGKRVDHRSGKAAGTRVTGVGTKEKTQPCSYPQCDKNCLVRIFPTITLGLFICFTYRFGCFIINIAYRLLRFPVSIGTAFQNALSSSTIAAGFSHTFLFRGLCIRFFRYPCFPPRRLNVNSKIAIDVSTLGSPVEPVRNAVESRRHRLSQLSGSFLYPIGGSLCGNTHQGYLD